MNIENLRINTLYELIKFSADNYPNNIAFVSDSESITYKRFYDDVIRAAKCLVALGYYGKHIALCGVNSYGWVVSYFACTIVGVVMPVADECEADEIHSLCKKGDCVLFIDGGYSGECSDITEINTVFWKNLCEKEWENVILPVPDREDVAAFIPTSGTMGKSRICMLTHKSLCADIMGSSMALDFSGNTVTVLPFHHSYGMLGGVFLGMVRGSQMALCPEVRYMSAVVKKHPPRYIFAVPVIVESIYKEAKKLMSACVAAGDSIADASDKAYAAAKNALGGRCEILVIGGAPLSFEAEEFFRCAGIAICPGYGLTECSPAVSVNPPFSNKLKSVGPPLKWVSVSVLEPNENGEGEIVINGDIVMKGYYKDAESDSQVFSPHGLLTGDIGRVDEDGFIYITGRKKNLIILANGKNIMPEEIEEMLDTLPTVIESLVFDGGSIIGARVYTEDEEKCKKEIDALNSRLPAYKRVSRLEFVSQPLPRNSLKKLIRKI